MPLVSLIYASKFSNDKFDAKELSKIHNKATEKNKNLDITGILAFGEDFFLQCLEGDRKKVNALYQTILADPRNHSPVLLEYKDISERQFSDWSMKLVLLTESKKNLVRRFAVSGEFEPFILSGSSASQLLAALK